jgi:cell division septation protein DedD
MRNNETGEFELVVGNKQLLSGFFIVVLLFAVAFAMGYVVGQNSRKVQNESAAASQPVPAAPTDARPQPIAPTIPQPQTPAAPADGAAQPTGEAPPPSSPQPTTQPARDTEAPAAAPPAPSPKAEAPPGSYWQIMAVPQPDAEVVVRSLKDKGFPASMSQGPNNLMRVLVGPYADTQSMGRAKTELESAGFHPIRK